MTRKYRSRSCRIRLPIHERLGDTREAAVTRGNIAHTRGDHNQAHALHARRLDTARKLGDLDDIAAACWDLARIDLARREYQAAFPRRLTGPQRSPL